MHFIYNKEKPACISDAIRNHDREGFIGFIDAPGGTGKTYGLNTFLNYARSQGDIALASAFSGVAALLLTGGKYYFFCILKLRYTLFLIDWYLLLRNYGP